MKYVPSRGGHAPGHLREQFCDLVDEMWPRHEASIELRKIAGVLWNCTDIMPGQLCSDLELPPGSTYAQGARWIRSW